MTIIPLLMIPVTVAIIGYHFFTQDIPPLDSLENYRPKTVSYIFSDDNRVIGEYSHEHRLVLPLNRVPQRVINAFLASEDVNFYQHPGIDLMGIARAAIKNVEAGHIVQGGSTITQQVTRSFLLSKEKSYERKIREAVLAYHIEQNLTKDEILYLYLNQIYLGHGAYGVESAAQLYFGKHVSELTVAESAMIAGMTAAPGRYSPFRNPKKMRERQKYVLGQMLDADFITLQEYDAALHEQLYFRQKYNVNLEVAPYFTEHVRREVEALYGDRLYNDGLRIYTTVNIEMQEAARKALDRGLSEWSRRRGYKGPLAKLTTEEEAAFRNKQADINHFIHEGEYLEALITQVNKDSLDILAGGGPGVIEKTYLKWALRGKSLSKVFARGHLIWVQALGPEPDKVRRYRLEQKPEAQGALVCLETATGLVKAMVGGLDFTESQFNRAVQAKRQPGSAFKPFLYATAIDQGFTPADVIWDEPVEYEDNGEIWRPQNYGKKFMGPITLYQALVLSRNVVAVKLMEKVGIKPVIRTARTMGLESYLAPYLSLALGSAEVSLLEMVSAYTTFPNLGDRAKPVFIKRIEDRDGRVVARFKPRREKALSPQTAYVVLHMMKGVVERGTATRVKALGRPVGGKTGTTNDLADAWFIGFTPEYTAGVWVGKDKREALGRSETGGHTAAPIFLYFMQDALEGMEVRDFTEPEGITYVTIDAYSGYQSDGWSSKPVKVAFKQDQVGPSQNSEYYYARSQGYEEGSQLVYIDGQYYRVSPSQPAWSEDTYYQEVSPGVYEQRQSHQGQSGYHNPYGQQQTRRQYPRSQSEYYNQPYQQDYYQDPYQPQYSQPYQQQQPYYYEQPIYQNY
jgi:penicillin-binding protein 1A